MIGWKSFSIIWFCCQITWLHNSFIIYLMVKNQLDVLWKASLLLQSPRPAWSGMMQIRIRIRIYLLARRNLLWDILRLPSSRRAALGLYVILTLWRGRGANQPPYALLHRSSPRYALCHGRRRYMMVHTLENLP